jgi:CRP-like cAMP-binding protein
MSLLGRVGGQARSALLSLGVPVKLDGGRQIMRVAEPSARAFLLLNGCVKVHGNAGGHEPLLAVRVGGDLVGEMGVLSGGLRSATVTTCSPTLAREIGSAELRAFLLAQPDVALAVACVLSDRLRWANERRVDFAAAGGSARVVRVLLTLMQTYGRAGETGYDLGVSLTQAEIASLAGVRLATAEKALRALAHAGVLEQGYKRVVVTDPARLRQLADSEGDGPDSLLLRIRADRRGGRIDDNDE